MDIFLILLALICFFAVVHTYLLYPYTTIAKGTRSSQQGAKETYAGAQLTISSQAGEPWPRVSVLMAVHNEEAVIHQKMDSLIAQEYAGNYRIFVGSDHSSDATNEILTAYAKQHQNVFFFPFDKRQGKPGIINQLVQKAPPASSNHVYLLTDASVMLESNVVQELCHPFSQLPDLAMADARMIHTGMRAEGIGQTEDLYISREVKLKQAEGKLWGYTIGPFGGCYALRSDFFRPVPDNFLVDDFFLCLSAYEAGGRGISVPTALCTEAVGQHLADEFRRKVRISAGNWQNARRFLALWWPPNRKLAYAFFSHKILRWLTPFLLLIIGLCLWILATVFNNHSAGWLFLSLLFLAVVLPLVDVVFTRVLHINWFPLRALRYFIAMNIALLLGFFRYLKGIRSNVWQPSKRH
ncbi:MAG: glycosyltransferase [Bacteroidota bacterium]